MEEYLTNMKSLRSQMNNFEEEGSNLAVEEQKKRTAVQTLERDLESVALKSKRLKAETNEMMETKGQLCWQIMEKRNLLTSLELESSTLSQTLDLLKQERESLLANLINRRAYYIKIKQELNSKFVEYENGLNARKASYVTETKMTEYHNQHVDITDVEDSVKETGAGKSTRNSITPELEHETIRLEDITSKKLEISQKNNEEIQLIEQLHHRMEDFPVDLEIMDAKTTGKEHHALFDGQGWGT